MSIKLHENYFGGIWDYIEAFQELYHPESTAALAVSQPVQTNSKLNRPPGVRLACAARREGLRNRTLPCPGLT